MVYPSNSAPDGVSLLTSEGVSASVQPFELVITLVLFFLVYLMLFIGWVRVVGRFIKEGPAEQLAAAGAGEAGAAGDAVVEALEEAVAEESAAPRSAASGKDGE